jgi:hypothetical protein
MLMVIERVLGSAFFMGWRVLKEGTSRQGFQASGLGWLCSGMNVIADVPWKQRMIQSHRLFELFGAEISYSHRR